MVPTCPNTNEGLVHVWGEKEWLKERDRGNEREQGWLRDREKEGKSEREGGKAQSSFKLQLFLCSRGYAMDNLDEAQCIHPS